ncbi:MAG: type VI secretion system baseplate subunit TssE [Alphaproteobacteria bacterium]|nr:MAG: type VI secretion system baseplate subunit TssE [Alphaproteobacteria bacterium]
MADVRDVERLQPSLLDRLTDDAPHETTESRDKRVIDVRRLREIVLRDLAWLLNTTSKADVIDPERFPNVTRSTLNYGIVEIAGIRAAGTTARDIERSIRDAIEIFEPRINPASLTVKYVRESGSEGPTLSFDIRADIWAKPLPLEIYMRTELDVTSGDFKLDRRG